MSILFFTELHKSWYCSECKFETDIERCDLSMTKTFIDDKVVCKASGTCANCKYRETVPCTEKIVDRITEWMNIPF